MNIDKDDGEWALCDKEQTNDFQTQFTQGEIDTMQQDKRSKGLDLNALKIEVPYDELDFYNSEEVFKV